MFDPKKELTYLLERLDCMNQERLAVQTLACSDNLSQHGWSSGLLKKVCNTLEDQQKKIESALGEHQGKQLYLRDQCELMAKQLESLKEEKNILQEVIQELGEENRNLTEEERSNVVRYMEEMREKRLEWWNEEDALYDKKWNCMKSVKNAGITQWMITKGQSTVPQMQMWERYMSLQKAGEKHKKHEQYKADYKSKWEQQQKQQKQVEKKRKAQRYVAEQRKAKLESQKEQRKQEREAKDVQYKELQRWEANQRKIQQVQEEKDRKAKVAKQRKQEKK